MRSLAVIDTRDLVIVFIALLATGKRGCAESSRPFRSKGRADISRLQIRRFSSP
jgi:hypothetical protein